MTNLCSICGKGKQYGYNVSHSHLKTKKIWEPNLQTRKVIQPSGNTKKIKVCSGCLKANKVLV